MLYQYHHNRIHQENFVARNLKNTCLQQHFYVHSEVSKKSKKQNTNYVELDKLKKVEAKLNNKMIFNAIWFNWVIWKPSLIG